MFTSAAGIGVVRRSAVASKFARMMISAAPRSSETRVEVVDLLERWQVRAGGGHCDFNLRSAGLLVDTDNLRRVRGIDGANSLRGFEASCRQ